MQPWASGPALGRKELRLRLAASPLPFFSASESLGQERELAAWQCLFIVWLLLSAFYGEDSSLTFALCGIRKYSSRT